MPNLAAEIPEYLDIKLKRAAIAVARTLDYVTAAEHLSLSVSELKNQVAGLEEKLCLHIFQPGKEPLELTKDGLILIQMFRETVLVEAGPYPQIR